MFGQNRYFRASIGVIIVQQVLLAASTWSIAAAGAAVSAGSAPQAKQCLVAFFVLALGAYLVSSLAAILAVKAENSVWKVYFDNTVEEVTRAPELGGSENRKLTSQWLSSEALPSIQYAVSYYTGATATIANVILTSSVFYIALGSGMGSIVASATCLSLLVVICLRGRIQATSTQIQTAKLNLLTRIDSVLANLFFANKSMAANSKRRFDERASDYFVETQRYIYLEQAAASVPTLISVTIILVSLLSPSGLDAGKLGVLVALLPRSLQLFGSVHALNIYLSQFVMIRQKIKNLKDFPATLTRQRFELQIDYDSVEIINMANGLIIKPREFLALLDAELSSNGRYLITGPNGAGKSTLLKVIKSELDDAILMSLGVTFGDRANELSTGQTLVEEMKLVIKEGARTLLLDEWDANLDQSNVAEINALLEDAARTSLVIEVRHHYIPPLMAGTSAPRYGRPDAAGTQG
ncbi:ABC transporter ATP-binding protein [Pseudomonas sp. v388]|uniref:ATP-binding cassette domain-containing protein n=1 Tax=Pseudomonas sp. v388 TaxID=2479849 RepID=UPI00131564F4|nr:ABC transporter ATP-binding protein [Pseudomonas sp. v388]